MSKERFSTVSVRMTQEEKEILQEYCDVNDLSMSQVIRKAIKDYLDKCQNTNG